MRAGSLLAFAGFLRATPWRAWLNSIACLSPLHCVPLPTPLCASSNSFCSRLQTLFDPVFELFLTLSQALCVMSSVRIKCDGCTRLFAPSGLSQHLSRTQDPRCRRPSVRTDNALGSSSDRRLLDTDPTVLNQVSSDLNNANLERPQNGEPQ